MSNQFLLMMVFLIVFASSVEAETVVLQNGTVFNSPILEKNKARIKIEVNGVPITYYAEDIRSINGVEPLEFLDPKILLVKPQTPMPLLSVEQGNVSSLSKEKSKTELILAFIDAFGTRESLTKNFEDLIKTAPPRQSEEIKKALNIDDLIGQLVPLYDKNFTEQELADYIKFYSSPEGKKLIQTIPLLMEQSVGISLKYLKEKLPNIPSKEIK